MLQPFDHIFQGMSIVIFWSLMIGILWLRTENPQLVGIIGVVMVSAYSYATDPNYIPLVRSVIKNNIRGVYKL